MAVNHCAQLKPFWIVLLSCMVSISSCSQDLERIQENKHRTLNESYYIHLALDGKEYKSDVELREVYPGDNELYYHETDAASCYYVYRLLHGEEDFLVSIIFGNLTNNIRPGLVIEIKEGGELTDHSVLGIEITDWQSLHEVPLEIKKARFEILEGAPHANCVAAAYSFVFSFEDGSQHVAEGNLRWRFSGGDPRSVYKDWPYGWPE